MQVDRFELLQQLGEGGFARVWKAREKTSGRTVALKLLKESLRADAEVIERFRREIFAVATIDSPYVVRMIDFGVAAADSFLAMEFVEGTSLRELLVGQPWSPGDVQIVVGQVCQALAAAHAVGIIHRDLKPENIMLVPSKDGTHHVKVLDFGFAKLVDLERKLELEPITQVGFCFGTPQYMAPEQMQGRPVAPSVDLFAAAVITYEMIAGRLPWDGPNARDIFTSVLTTPVPPIMRAHKTLTRLAQVNELLAAALARKAALRPASAEALFSALESALFGAPQSRGGGTFASVMGKTISIPDLAFEPTAAFGAPAVADGSFGGGTFGGQTEVDVLPPAKMTPRRLPSGWHGSLHNLLDLDGEAGNEELEPTLLKSKPLPPTIVATRAAAGDNKRSETLRVVPTGRRLALGLWWLVVLAVLLAGAVGYYAGTLRR
jgi:serine/threonine-protein kinase